MISEAIIEQTILALEEESYYQSYLESLTTNQEDLFIFYQSENFEVLLQEEYDLMIFMTLVIFGSIERSIDKPLDLIPIKKIEDQEEVHWMMMQQANSNTFRDRVTIFFDKSKQEELLAFVEDSLVLDDESSISAVGREILFVNMSAIIECATR